MADSKFADRIYSMCAGAALFALCLGLGAEAHARVWSNSQVSLPYKTQLGDIDGDGLTDFVQGVGDQIFVSRTDAKATRVFAATLPSMIQRVVVGNFGVATKDEVCATLAYGRFECYKIGADGRSLVLASTDVGFVASEDAVFTGDFDGDGLAELAQWRPSAHSFTVRKRNTAGSFIALANFSLGDLAGVDLTNKQIRIGNFGGSAASDLLFLDRTTGAVSVYWTVTTNGQSRFVWQFTSNAGQVTAQEEFVVADIDGSAPYGEELVLHNQTTGAYRLRYASVSSGALVAVTGVDTSGLSTTAGAQAFFGRFYFPNTPQPELAPARDDVLFYVPSTRSVTRANSYFPTGGQRLYLGGDAGAPPWRAPDLRAWLNAHQTVAGAIKWEVPDVTFSNCYHVDDNDKVSWLIWTSAQQNELNTAYVAAWNWYFGSDDPLNNLQEAFSYPWASLYYDVGNDNAAPEVQIGETDARALFMAWAAHTLMVEIGGLTPWSLTDLSAQAAADLLDSASYEARCNSYFSVGASIPGHPNYVTRADNLGSSLIAPPRATFAFLKTAGLLGTTRLDSIGRLLNWSRGLSHFYNDYTYGNMYAFWQYRGIPPITRILNGTTATPYGYAHWTAGCHGSNGFYRNVLRALNVPMEITNICGHSVAYFISEHRYMDHGDDPYNADFRASGRSAISLLIDETTFTTRFGSNQNNHDGDSTMCGYIGWMTTHTQ